SSSSVVIGSSTRPLMRYGEYRRISGVRHTEYAAQEAESPSASSSPPRSADSLPPEPRATSATPPNDASVASQKRRLSRSRPTAEASAAAKIGVVPMISETVVALASLSE